MKKLICIFLCIMLTMQLLPVAFAASGSEFYYNDGTNAKLTNTEGTGITCQSADAPIRGVEKAIHISGTALVDLKGSYGKAYMATSNLKQRTETITAEMDFYVESGGGMAFRVAQYDKNGKQSISGTVPLCDVYDEWLEPNRWYKFAVEMEANGTGDTYQVWRNGILTDEGSFSATGYGLNFLRIQPIANKESDYSLYLTNIRIYNGSYTPQKPAQLNLPDSCSVEEDIIYVPEGTDSSVLSQNTVVKNGVVKGVFEQDAKSLRIGTVKEGDLLCTASDDGIYTYYKIKPDFRDYIVKSESYQVDQNRGVISQISCGTTAEQLLADLYSSSGDLVVTDECKTVYDSDDLIKKGMVVESRRDNQVIFTYALKLENLIDWDFDTKVPRNANAFNLRLIYETSDDDHGVALKLNARDNASLCGLTENVILTENLYLLTFDSVLDSGKQASVMLDDAEILKLEANSEAKLCSAVTDYTVRNGKWTDYSLLIDKRNETVSFYANGEIQAVEALSVSQTTAQLKLLFEGADGAAYLDRVRLYPITDTNRLTEMIKPLPKTTNRDIMLDFSNGDLIDLDFDLSKAKEISLDNGSLSFSSGYIYCNDRSFDGKTYISFRVNREKLENNKLTVLLRGRGNTTYGAIRFISLGSNKVEYLPDIKDVMVTEQNSEKELTFCAVFDNDNDSLKIYRDGTLMFETHNLSSLDNGRWKDFSFGSASCRYTLSGSSGNIALKHLIITRQDILKESYVVLKPLFMKNGLVITEPVDGCTAYLTVYANKDTAIPIQAILARFKDDVLDLSKMEESVSLQNGECVTFALLPEIDADTDLIRTYIWNENMSPLCLASEIPITESALWKRRERTGASHPYIGVEPERFEELRKTNIPLEKYWIKSVIAGADKILAIDYTNPESDSYIGVYNSDGERSEAGGNMLTQVQSLAFAWQLTGQEKYAKRILELLELTAAPYNGEASDFPNGNPDHFLDTSAMAYAYAIAYDWCYDYFTTEQRKKIENSIMRYAIEPYMKVSNSSEWSKAMHNRNLVNHGGIFMAAAAIADNHTELYQVILSAAEKMRYGASAFNPVGAWLESGAYWSYSVKYLIPALQTMLTFLGTDFGILENEGLKETGDFAIALQGPSGSNNNYHDGGTMRWLNSSPCLFWFADRFDLPHLNNMKLEVMKTSNVSTKIWDLLWYNSDKISDEILPLNQYFEGTELVTMRSAWNDSSASFASFHGGVTDGSHTHIDGGAFVFDYSGVRWASDLPNESYDAGGYGSGLDSKNTYYRVRAEGHNTLVIDPDESAGQDLDAFPTISCYDFESDSPWATLDLTDSYKTKASNVLRTLQLTDNKTSLLVKDVINLNQNSDVYWFMHTQADATVKSENSVLLKKDGKTMVLEFSCNRDAKISIVDAKPMSTSPEPYGGTQSDNSDYKKVRIKITGSGNTELTVKIRPESAEPL